MLAAVLCTSCDNDTATAGRDILSESDQIIVGCDTFSTHSSLSLAHSIYSTPDSFLLGECDSRFGTIHADIVAQFTCPVGFQYPEGAVVDSVCLYFYYNSWFGDGHTPMSVAVYEIDKQSISYNNAYSHELDINEYCTVAPENMVVDKKRIIVAATPTDSVYNSNTESYIPYVRCRLTDEFAQRLFAIRDFSSLNKFTDQFKGLYIESDFGSATLLHVQDINLALYYHFEYNKAGRDTTVTDIKGFYANSEVRQINRYTYFNTDIEALSKDSDTYNYIVSPANLYTRVSLPIRKMGENILSKMTYLSSTGDSIVRRPYINKAELYLEVLNVYDGYSTVTRDDWAQPASYMMLIKESEVDGFFKENKLPNDTCAILGSLAATTIDDSTYYYYKYDLAELLTQKIREIKVDTIEVPETLDMLLVPVSVTTGTSTSSSSSSTTITAVKHEQTVTATVIRSANNVESPLSLEVVYSGF